MTLLIYHDCEYLLQGDWGEDTEIDVEIIQD